MPILPSFCIIPIAFQRAFEHTEHGYGPMGAISQILKVIEIEDRVLWWADSWGRHVVDSERPRQRANVRWSMADDICPFCNACRVAHAQAQALSRLSWRAPQLYASSSLSVFRLNCQRGHESFISVKPRCGARLARVSFVPLSQSFQTSAPSRTMHGMWSETKRSHP